MLRSMTGYGIGSATVDDFQVQVNLQSVNSRYAEQRMRLSGILSSFEQLIRENIKNRFRRGDISVQIELSTGEQQPFRLELNKKVIRAYTSILEELDSSGIRTAPLTLRDVLSIDDAVRKVADETAGKKIEQALVQALEKAMNSLEEMQLSEGVNLDKDISSGIDVIEKSLMGINRTEKDMPKEIELKVDAIGNYLSTKLPEDRVAQEVALALARMDIHEEVVRLESHIQQFRETTKLAPPLGTKLNFIIQEIHREANTIASKAQSGEIVREVIEIKEQTERIREQLRNVQ